MLRQLSVRQASRCSPFRGSSALPQAARLQSLLQRHLQLTQHACYSTNDEPESGANPKRELSEHSVMETLRLAETSTPPPSTHQPLSPLSESVRMGMRKLAHPVVVIHAVPPPHSETPAAGMLVSSFNTITLAPEPLVSFNIKLPSQTHAALLAAPTFDVSALHSEAHAHHFSGHYRRLFPWRKDNRMTVGAPFAEQQIAVLERRERLALERRQREQQQREQEQGQEQDPDHAQRQDQKQDMQQQQHQPPPPTDEFGRYLEGGRLWGLRCELLRDKMVAAGDHVVVVARVVAFLPPVGGRGELQALSYQRGTYRVEGELASVVRKRTAELRRRRDYVERVMGRGREVRAGLR